MKTIIVGLGNPGDQYYLSRHNLGFMFLDYLQKAQNLEPFVEKKKHKALVSANSNVLLVKPQTFMNLSGEAAQSVCGYYCDQLDAVKDSIEKKLDNLIVVHDDLDLEFGSFKLQFGVGPRDHNGLLSIYHHLKTNSFWHLRVGADDRAGDRSIPVEKYVLQPLSTEQQMQLPNLFEQMLQSLRIKKSELLS